MSSDDDAGERPSALNSADPLRNFSLSMEERVRALTIGVPSYAARKRRIEDSEEGFVNELVELHEELSKKGESKASIASALARAADALDLRKVNALVVDHNRYYPVEANLPMDRRSGDYLVYGRPWRPEEPYTAARLLGAAERVLARRAARSKDADDTNVTSEPER